MNPDTRIRYGFCESLDEDPQIIYERRKSPTDVYVAVIPIPPNHITLPPSYQIASDQ